MLYLEKFCCGCSLRTGVIFFIVLDLISGLWTLVVCLGYTEQDEDIVFVLSCVIATIVISTLGLYGIVKENMDCVIPYSIMKCIFIVVLTKLCLNFYDDGDPTPLLRIMLSNAMIKDLGSFSIHMTSILFFTMIVVYVYCLAVTLSYFKRYQERIPYQPLFNHRGRH